MRPVASLAVVGAGPVGLALAVAAAKLLPRHEITLYDARSPARSVGDARTLALSWGSVQLLRRLGGWDEAAATQITQVHVSQQTPGLLTSFVTGLLPNLPSPQVTLHARTEGVPMLGAVLGYGDVVAPLLAAWQRLAAAEPQRLATRFDTPVAALKPMPSGVEVDAGVAERADLAVLAEGGLFADQSAQPVRAAYGQNAWVGTVTLAEPHGGVAHERFTPGGPVALLPLRPATDGSAQAALVWCVQADGDVVADLDAQARVGALNALLPSTVQVLAISTLSCFPLGLNASRTLVDGRSIRIGNAAQTLHPVAGQGLNLGLRDAFALVLALRDQPSIDAALRRVEWQRAPDRWRTIVTTDLLARAFAGTSPVLATARAAGLAALQAAPPLKSLLARHMMFGLR